MKDSRVRKERLFRCCIDTVLDDPGPDEEGRLLRCAQPHADRTMIFREGAWEWHLLLN